MPHVFEDDETARPEPEGPRAFVTGWPVFASRSPLIHTSWLTSLGLAGSYVRCGVPPEELSEFLAGLGRSGFVGGNVTVPHKEAVFAAVHRTDGDAEAIGAVNTLWFEDGRLIGGNTDAYGFAANLDERLAGWTAAETALVLGAGGAARAVVHALLSKGVARVLVMNRDTERARRLAERFGPAVSGHGEAERAALLPQADLLVNTVPVPSPDPGEVRYALPGKLPDLSALKDDALVTDIVYVPLETPVIGAARARGLRTADGLGMLLHQAVPGFQRWFARRPAVDENLRARIVRDIERGL